MKVSIGGAGFSWYEIESDHQYASVIAHAINDEWNDVIQFDRFYKNPIEITKAMFSDDINKFLANVFYSFTKICDQEYINKNLEELFRSYLKQPENEKEKNQIENMIQNRLKNYDDSDISKLARQYLYSRVLKADKIYKTEIKELMSRALSE